MPRRCCRRRTPVRHGRVSVAVSVLAVFAALASAIPLRASTSPQDASPAPLQLAPSAIEQIEALIREKESRSPVEQKLDSQLIYELRMRTGQAIAAGVNRLETDVPYASDGHAVVDVTVTPSADLDASLAALGADVVSRSPDGTSLRVHIAIERIEALAALSDVVFVQPKQEAAVFHMPRRAALAGLPLRAAVVARGLSSAMGAQEQQTNITATGTGQGSRSSEGDITHLAFAARAAFGARGAGVKIGVLSDGVSSLATSQARGDLGAVTVLPGQRGAGDEGTAMLEIVHDLAPDAELFFATGVTSVTTFAQNIRALRAAGCDIIVDDVFYFVESPFHDGQTGSVVSPRNQGLITQAVNDVTAGGALYFTSAGNYGNLDDGTSGTWEGDFADGGPNGVNRLHDFGGGRVTTAITVTSTNPVNLYWSDPLGASTNDYDLFRLNAAGTAVLASSTTLQNGTQDPYEQMSSTGSAPGQIIVILKKASAQPRFLHLDTNGGRLSIGTAGQLHGHAQAAGALAVAAAPALASFPAPFSAQSVVEEFSSDGPRRVFYGADNTPYTPDNLLATGGQLRAKPDLTAADGVQVTGVGGVGSPFFGTSAAAPHAAAIAALVKSANPAVAPDALRRTLLATALDIEAPGVDRDAGAGIVMPTNALRALGTAAPAFVEVVRVDAIDNPGNNNGVPEAGEGVRLSIPLANFGNTPASGVTATLTSSTPGITIEQNAARAYGNIAVAATTTAAPILVSIASDFPCPKSASFALTVHYSGGPSPRVFQFDVPIGVTSYRITKKMDGSAPIASAGVVTATGVQTSRLNRDSIASTCGAQKPTPTLAFSPLSVFATYRRFDAYTFNTCAASTPSCVTVNVQGNDAINLFGAAYSPSFSPADVQQNYRADAGASSLYRTFSFDHPGGGVPFAVDVHDVAPGPPSATPYTLTVSGACMGACAPPNRPPIASAQDVTVSADPLTCQAPASIDHGTIDPDGDALVLTQSPAGPYPIGTTRVLLTATDPSGAFSQTAASVTVVDSTPPSINGLVLRPAPSRGDWVDVTVDYNGADGCSAVTCTLSVVFVGPVRGTALATQTVGAPVPRRTGSSDSRGEGDDNARLPQIAGAPVPPSTGSSNSSGEGVEGHPIQPPIVLDAHHVSLDATRSGVGNSRTYAITVTCTDAAGNTTTKTATITVRRD